jgi:ketosteroid isomerase-like protein
MWGTMHIEGRRRDTQARMMRPVVALAVLAIASCSGGAGARPARPPVPADVVAAVESVIEQWRQAYELRSVDSLAPLYAHEPELVVVREGNALTGWPAVEQMLKERLAKATSVRVKLGIVQVSQLTPEVATAVATMTREIAEEFATFNETGTLTLTLRKDPGGRDFRIVVEHYSYKRPS